MKTITQNFIKGLLVIVLFTGVSVVLSTTGVQIVNEARAAGGGSQGPAGQAGQLTAASVTQYLTSHGYVVQSLSPISGTNSWRAYTINPSGELSITTVYLQSNLLQSTDVPN